jgi:signal transduction histidine kinase
MGAIATSSRAPGRVPRRGEGRTTEHSPHDRPIKRRSPSADARRYERCSRGVLAMMTANLLEFMRANRPEIITRATKKLHDDEGPHPGLAAHVGAFVDEVIGDLERVDGVPGAPEPQCPSKTAVAVGEHRQHHGLPIATVAASFGVVSDVSGEIATEKDLSFPAREYHVFNLCIDRSIATAIETYLAEAQNEQEHRATERVAFLAHELRNATSSAQMAFALLRDGHVGIGSRTSSIIERSHARIQRLVGQTLLAAQLRAGVDPAFERVALGPLLAEVADDAVPERGVHVVVEIEGDLHVTVDARLLTSALVNLVQNGIKHTKRGGHVVLRARAAEGGVAIEVEDECGGLPPGVADELFAPFLQRSTDRRGFGLGLAITREAIDATGGTTSVRDQPGKGCVFTVRLPAKRDDA